MLDMKIADYRITSDARQIILSKVRRDENGEIKFLERNGKKEESRSDIGYYPNLKLCLIAIQRDYTLGSDTTIRSIIEYKKALERITMQFEQMCEIEEEGDR